MKTKPPKALDSIVDVVLAYRPKAKSKPKRTVRVKGLSKFQAALNQLPEKTKKALDAALDAVVDTVLDYRPKAKSKPARRRKRLAKKIAKDGARED